MSDWCEKCGTIPDAEVIEALRRERDKYKAACNKYSEDEMLCGTELMMQCAPTIGEVIEALRRERDDLKDQITEVPTLMRKRDAMTAERDAAKSFAIMYSEEAAKAQAREQQLREALHLVSLASQNSMTSKKDIGVDARRALALPHDDTALKAWGAKLLRDAAGKMSIASDYAVLFRMADGLEKK